MFSNNYVRFFKLFDEAGPLQRLLLQHALAGLRAHAAAIFRSAYLKFPVNEMARLLQLSVDQVRELLSSECKLEGPISDTVYFKNPTGALTKATSTAT